MNSICRSTAATAVSLALLAALAACGERAKEPSDQASVEINRQGMEGAKASSEAIGVDEQHRAREGYAGTLGAKGDTSVMDPDVLIAERVKAALASNPQVAAASVDVHSADGDVTLKGTAPDPAARDRATEIARAIPSVRSVDNQLKLG